MSVYIKCDICGKNIINDVRTFNATSIPVLPSLLGDRFDVCFQCMSNELYIIKYLDSIAHKGVLEFYKDIINF